jgi:hypothetical protein
MPEDHYLAPDIERATELVFAGELARLVQREGSIVVLP